MRPRPTCFVSDGPLFPAAGKVGKRAGRNQRFLHFLARYIAQEYGALYHTFTQIFLCRSDKGLSQQQRRCRWLVRRTTLSVLPLQCMSGSGARGTSVRHTVRHGICSVNAWYMVLKSERYSVGGFLNRRFKWRFCLLLPPRAKVGRSGERNTPAAGARNTPSPWWQPQNSPLFYTKTPLS